MTEAVRSVFEAFQKDAYPYHFDGTLHINIIMGGVPSNEKVAEGWIRSKMGENADEQIKELVEKTMAERGITQDEAVDEVAELKNLNGFKRTGDGVLYVEGRQLKAGLKEAASVAVSSEQIEKTGWGSTRKWLTTFLPEHVFVVEEELLFYRLVDGEKVYVTERDGIHTGFVHTPRGSAIQLQEFLRDVYVDFTVVADWPFTAKDWGIIWLKGQFQGLGASRSQGRGTYKVTRWDFTDLSTPDTKIPGPPAKVGRPRKAVAAE